ncbi:MAG: permease prefix domain 2-containing transporter [Candidatus Sulfotelmatobacter sp.]
MMPEENFVQPPRVAAWLVNLFTPAEESESIAGDLMEEFSHLASKWGVAFARRWYWRQTGKTIAHLFAAGFRTAPWSIAATVAAGFFLHRLLQRLPGAVLSKATDRYLMFWSAHFQAYLWLLDGMGMAHLLMSLLVGCAVAWAAKGREMLAAVTLALIFCPMIGAALVWVAMHGRVEGEWVLWSCADPVAIVVGGLIVRTLRSAKRDSSPKQLGMTGV